MGRRKIEMKMVKDNSSRQVTFSKRRTGLFKKANELATLCGAEVAIVVFSPGGKPFSFGHPNVESLLKQLQAEKKRGAMLDKAIKAKSPLNCQASINELSLNDLQTLKGSLEDLRENLKVHASEMEASSSLLLLANPED